MLHPSLQLDFYDPISNFEMPTYNGFILSLFCLICGGLLTILLCSNPMRGESMVNLNLLFVEGGVFISTCLVVLSLCFPGLVILYTQNPDTQVGYSLPVTAYQWYWTIGWEGSEVEMYMDQLENVKLGTAFQMETSDCGVIPLGINTTFFITSNDVLHAFSIPTAFVKADAVPGRLNAMSLNFSHPGVFYGQCSELCGVGHSYMPIKLEVMLPNNAS
uniref:cytochrome-c oxidase n=1 Tax=Salpa younti TaxID=2072449 RepID=A0AA86M991_9UROC|nr:cytochrome c oxidase subunit II [Salpa younti]